MKELIRKGGYDRRRTVASQVVGSPSKPLDSEESKVLAPVSEEAPSKKTSAISLRPQHTFKVIVVGDVAVGKSSLLQRMDTDEFSQSKPTIGFDHVNFDTTLADHTTCRLEVWDTAGSEAFGSMSSLFYRDSAAAIICFKLTDRSSFENVPTWVDKIKDQYPDEEGVVKYLVGL